MVGVPQLADKYVELGGIKVTTVAGAVPNAVKGEDVAVPSLILSLDPGPDPPGSDHVVVIINCVPDAAVLAATVMLCPV
jgi:hypothetical protein